MFKYWLKYRFKKISKKKLIIWSTILLSFVLSLVSIVDYYAAGNKQHGGHATGIVDDTVYINDFESDWNYYMGLNYTEIVNRDTLPGKNTNKYNENTLIPVQITYDGTNENGKYTGYVSYDENEQQSKFVYYKYYPIKVNSNGEKYIQFELLDSPFAKRPTYVDERDGKTKMFAFNGWVCNPDLTGSNNVNGTEGMTDSEIRELGQNVCNRMTFFHDWEYQSTPVKINVDNISQLKITLSAMWVYPTFYSEWYSGIDNDLPSTGYYQVSTGIRSAYPTQRIYAPAFWKNTEIFGHPCNYTLKSGYDSKYYVMKTVSEGETFTGYEINNFKTTTQEYTLRPEVLDKVCEKETCTYLAREPAGLYELGNSYFYNTKENKIKEMQDFMVVRHKKENRVDENGNYVIKNGKYVYDDVDGEAEEVEEDVVLIKAQVEKREVVYERVPVLENPDETEPDNPDESNPSEEEIQYQDVPKLDENGKYVFEYIGEYSELYIVIHEDIGQIQLYNQDGTPRLDDDNDFVFMDLYRPDGELAYKDAENYQVEVEVVLQVFEYTTYTLDNTANFSQNYSDKYYNYSICENNNYSNGSIKAGEIILSDIFEYGDSLGTFFWELSGADARSTDRYGQRNHPEYLLYDPGRKSCEGIFNHVNCGTPNQMYKYVQPGEPWEKWLNRVYTDENGVIQFEKGMQVDNRLNMLSYMLTRDTSFVVVAYDYQFDLTTGFKRSENQKSVTLTSVGSPKTIRMAPVNASASQKHYSFKSDFVLENLKIHTEATNQIKDAYDMEQYTDSDGAKKAAYYSVDATWANLKISRTVSGVGNNKVASTIYIEQTNTADNLSRFIIEGGSYNQIFSSSSNGDNQRHINDHFQYILGSDYDRVIGNHDNLTIYHQVAGAYRGSSWNSKSASNQTANWDMRLGSEYVVKSGTYGQITDPNDPNYSFSGIYVGQGNKGQSSVLRILKLEGGIVHTINGGFIVDSNYYNKNMAGIYITGGTVTNIFGGAVEHETGGNRIISVTGGEVRHSVIGGSNSTSSTQAGGILHGNSVIYIGGSAVIGDGTAPNPSYKIDTPGSVYGAGLGTAGSTKKAGYVRTSHIIVNLTSGEIKGNVYGAGNYGLVDGEGRNSETVLVRIELLKGTILGNVYGAGNNAGVGTTAGGRTGHVQIDVHDINMINSNIYGGANNSGDLYGRSIINLCGGSINGVYGGGFGKNTKLQGDNHIETMPVYKKTTTSGLKTTLWESFTCQATNPLDVNEIYGGSALGYLGNGGTEAEIIINGGDIGTIYGGGRGTEDDLTIKPNTWGSSLIIINSGTIDNIFGGTNIAGDYTSSNITVNGGEIGTIYGGSKGSEEAVSASIDSTSIIINDGLIRHGVYGGGMNAPTEGDSKIQIKGGRYYSYDDSGKNIVEYANIFGGGQKASVEKTYIYIDPGISLYNVFGGSDVSGVVQETNLNFKDIEIKCNTYGGGREAETILAKTTITNTNYSYELVGNETAYNAQCGSAYGGGADADVTTAQITLNSGSMINVFGGSNAGGTVRTAQVTVNGGELTNIFGGNNLGGSTVNSNVNINSSNLVVENVFGGSNGYDAEISGNTQVNIRESTINGDVFGGGNQARVAGNTVVNMYSGNVRSIYGGGNRSFVGNAKVNTSGAIVEKIATGTTQVNVVSGTVNRNIYGSSNASFVYGTTTVRVGDYAKTELGVTGTKTLHIKGGVFAGSETNADSSTKYDDSYEGVTGDGTGGGTGLVQIGGSQYKSSDTSTLLIDGSIYGSGNNSKVLYGSSVYITDLGTKKNPLVITSIQRAKNVYITDSQLEINGTVDRADPNSYKYSLIRLDDLYLLGSSASKGTYLYLRQGATILKQYNSGSMVSGVFKPQVINNNNDVLTPGVADNRIYMLTNKVLSVSTSDAPLYGSDAGRVTGMTYLGMFTHENGSDIVRGIYDYTYSNNSVYNESQSGTITDTAYTYVYGMNNKNETERYQIENNGFYTSVVPDKIEGESDNGKKIVYDYITVTPIDKDDTSEDDTLYYKWVIGNEPAEIVVDLIADKYSESGAVNALISIEDLFRSTYGYGITEEWRDAIMTIRSIDTTNFGATLADATTAFDGLLVDKNDIPTINVSDKNNDNVVDANNYFALVMGTTSTGWLDNYKTNFYDNSYDITNDFCSVGTGNCNGNQIYVYDSTIKKRSLSFWLYHSKNLDFKYVDKSQDTDNMLISMNSIYIDVEFRNPHGDPTAAESTMPVRITVNISLSDGELDKYGGVIAPGKKYTVFQNTPTSISSNGSFSIYQSLSLDLNQAMASSGTGEKWEVGKLYHQAKEVEVVDNNDQVHTVEWSESYRYLASSHLLPVGTVITMLDLKDNKQYYYEVTQELYDSKLEDFNKNNQAKYYLTDFIRMGSVTGSNKFDDDMNEEHSKKYYFKDDMSELAVEEFVFNVDFANANVDVINPEGDKYYFYLQLARIVTDEEGSSENIIISTNGTPMTDMVYTIMPQVSSEIKTNGGYVKDDGTISEETTIYVGENAELRLNTSLIQLDKDNNLLSGVSDTQYDDYKIGAKISVKRPKLDASGNVVKDEYGEIVYEDVTNDLFGTVIEINNQVYYPQTDGSTRLELAGRVTEIISDINVDFSNSSLTYGEYVLVVDTFASYDGLYYGDFEVFRSEFPFTLLNNQFGLDVKTETPAQVTHDMYNGQDINGDTQIHYLVDIVTGVAEPNLKVSLERRDYGSIYETAYESIPLSNLFEEIKIGDSDINIMTNADTCFKIDIDGGCYEYNLGPVNNSVDVQTYDIYLKLKNGPDSGDLNGNKADSKWKSGTYRVIYTLYDGDVPVGNYYEYLVIRNLGVTKVEFEGSGN